MARIFTKEMLKSCVRLTTDCLPKYFNVTGAFYLEDSLYINNLYGAVKFENISKDKEKEIKFICGENKADCLWKFLELFELIENKELYPECHILDFSLRDIRKVATGKDFNIQYNKDYLLRIAKCIDNKNIKVCFPTQYKKPIFIYGQFGVGLLMPIRPTIR